MKVECLYEPNGNYYSGVIAESADCKLTINWDDCDTKNRTGHPISHIRRLITNKITQAVTATAPSSVVEQSSQVTFLHFFRNFCSFRKIKNDTL